MKLWIYAHDNASQGATELARALGIKKIKHEGSSFRGSRDKVVINWGSSTLPDEITKCIVLNTSLAVSVNSNKTTFFQQMSGTCTVPPWATDRTVAEQWVREGATVVGRKLTRSSGGEGIEFYDALHPVQACPLYTKYIPKKDEYRVHFVGGQIIDYQRKALRPEVDRNTVDWKVRNLENGFIFVRGDVVLPDDVRDQAQACIEHTDLDFGAIDLIYNDKQKRAYVLEVNTAPGLVGTTVENYANALRNYVR